MSVSGPLGNFAGNTGAGGALPILALDANPTLTATGSIKAQLGSFESELFLHLTALLDTNWANLTAMMILTREVGALSTLAANETPLNDLASKRAELDRLVLNAYGDFIFGKAVIRIQNGQPSGIVDNDRLSVPAANNGAPFLLEFKRTGGFVATAGFTTVDLSDLVDSLDDASPAEISHRIRDVVIAATGDNSWSTTAEEADAPTWHALSYIGSDDGEVRGVPTWTLVTPIGAFAGTLARAGYSPLVDAHGGTQNNLTRLGPRDVAALIALLSTSPVGNVVRSAEFDVDFSQFTAGGAATSYTVDLPELPVGAIVVAANAHVLAHAWAATGASAVTVEFTYAAHGPGGLVTAFDGTTAESGSSESDSPRGLTITHAAAIVRMTGATMADLTAGDARLEVLYRMP